MNIQRSTEDTFVGPADWFVGDVYVDMVKATQAPSRVNAAVVHFTPGARTNWHTHPVGQTILVTEGAGLCQREGGPVEAIRPGDSVYFEPNENHWHGSAPGRFMAHVAIQEPDDSGTQVTWGSPVTDEQYTTPANG